MSRFFTRQKVFSLINILGLTVGITCSLMIFLFISNEFSYDSFHKKGKDIYRVMRKADVTGSGQKEEIAYVSAPYAPALLNSYPEAIKKAVRVLPSNNLFSTNDVSFNEKNVYLADSDFFQLFDFPLLRGNPATVLKEPGSIVLTESTAKKYFGNEDPIGKIMQMDKTFPLTVTGIASDVPLHSHLQFDMIVPLSNYSPYEFFTEWPNNSLFVYIQLNPDIDPKQLISRFPKFMDTYMGPYVKENGLKIGLTLDPLHEVYFNQVQFDNVKHGNREVVYIFMSIAFLILIIACINYMNLSTARAGDRSKEIGMRKILGAVRRRLAWQFIGESFLFALFAGILAVLLLQILMPAYDDLLGYTLPSFWNNPWFFLFLLSIISGVGFLAGLYPAIVLSSFSPMETLRGKGRAGRGGVVFRRVLVVIQFGISVLLIFCMTIIMSQMQYVKNQDLGFDKDQTLIIRLDNNDITDGALRFKSLLQTDPYVQSTSLMSGEPGGFRDVYTFTAEGKPGTKWLFRTEFADFDCAKTLGLKIIAGRDLSTQYGTDSAQGELINRTAASKLGYTPQQAIGKRLKNILSDSISRTIIGVVEDFHFASLKEPIEPMVISPRIDRRVAVVKLKAGNLVATVNSIKNIYTTVAPGYPFEYNFLDEQFNRQYRSEIRQQSILTIFSIIAIFIACLGLFGLASFTAQKRTREIGVRKVLGSSTRGILALLLKDLLKPVLIGIIIAIPLGYYLMQKWLESFAYRTSVHWWMFACASVAAIFIALFTIGFQATKAAQANPINTLRNE